MAETPAVCEQLHLPLQSGSDRVLTAMRRGYRARRYLERLAAARAAIDDLAVTTDLIVGFPGETDADFDETLAVVAEAEFDSAYTFVFSPRPGTRAAARPLEVRPRRRRPRALRAARRGRRALGAAAQRRARGPRRRGARRGAEQEGRRRRSPPARARASPSTSPRTQPRSPRAASPPSRSTTARPTTCWACSTRSPPGPDTARGSRSRHDDRTAGPRRTDRVGKVARRAPGGARRRRPRDRLARRDGGLPRDGPRDRQADARRARRGALPPHRRARPCRGAHGPALPDAVRRGDGRRRRARAHRDARRRLGALPSSGARRALDPADGP